MIVHLGLPACRLCYRLSRRIYRLNIGRMTAKLYNKDIMRVDALTQIPRYAVQTSTAGDDLFHGIDPSRTDVYFSADVETDGPIPGPFSMLSFAIVAAGSFDGLTFRRPKSYTNVFYREISPISNDFEEEALKVNGLDRNRLIREGETPELALTDAAEWVRLQAGSARPVLVAYPLSFDWTWLYWYFVRFSKSGSPFDYSRCFDIKTAYAVKAGIPISGAGRGRLPSLLSSQKSHTHHAVDDAIEQAEIFANIFEWEGRLGGTRKP